MPRYWGTLVMVPTGSIQLVADDGKKQLLVSNNQGDMFIPLEKVYEALEDDWNLDAKDRHKRIAAQG